MLASDSQPERLAMPGRQFIISAEKHRLNKEFSFVHPIPAASRRGITDGLPRPYILERRRLGLGSSSTNGDMPPTAAASNR